MALRVSWQWRPLYDKDVEQLFIVSPFFGSLHAIKVCPGTSPRVPGWCSLLGCTGRTLSESGWVLDSVVPPGDAHSWYSSDPKHADWTEDIRRQLTRVPLALVVNQIERRSSPPFSLSGAYAERSTLEELIQAALTAWNFSRDPECLPRALFRFQWLRARAVFPRLVIGVHLPTDRMHAWVELNHRVIGEEPDEMLCYQSAVRFFPRLDA
jgi:hypothetical protein